MNTSSGKVTIWEVLNSDGAVVSFDLQQELSDQFAATRNQLRAPGEGEFVVRGTQYLRDPDAHAAIASKPRSESVVPADGVYPTSMTAEEWSDLEWGTPAHDALLNKAAEPPFVEDRESSRNVFDDDLDAIHAALNVGRSLGEVMGPSSFPIHEVREDGVKMVRRRRDDEAALADMTVYVPDVYFDCGNGGGFRNAAESIRQLAGELQAAADRIEQQAIAGITTNGETLASVA